MNTLRYICTISWIGLLGLEFDGITQAEEGFFDDEQPALMSAVDVDGGGAFSPDGLTLYFSTSTLDGPGGLDIYLATRERTVDDKDMPVPFGEPFVPLDEINTPGKEKGPEVSADGLRLYFYSRPPGHTNNDIYVATRDRILDEHGRRVPFGTPVNLEEINDPDYHDSFPRESTDGLILCFQSKRPGQGDYDMWMATRDRVEDENGNRIPFSDPVNIAEINGIAFDGLPYTPEGRSLFFSSARDGEVVVYWATRERTEDEFGERIVFDPPDKLGATVNKGPWNLVGGLSRDWPACRSQLFLGREHGAYLLNWHPDRNANGVSDCREIVDFQRGNADGVGAINITDAIYLLSYLSLGALEPPCMDAADSDDGGSLDRSDAIYILNYLFLGGPPPEQPFGECTSDSTHDALTCDAFDACPEAR